MNLNKFVYELKKLNGDTTEIRRGIARCDTLADSRIFVSTPVDQLVLPEGYQLKGSYIVSDDGKSELFVDGMANVIAGHSYPDYGFVDVNPCANYEELAIAMQKINPDAEIRILNPELNIPYDDFISSNVDIRELALPMGYYYDENREIISSVASYSTIKFVKEDKMDEAIEILPRYDFKKDFEEQYAKDLYRMHPQLDPNSRSEKKNTKLIQKIKSRFHK